METTQPEFTFRPGVTSDDVETLRDFLAPRGWQTRRQITFALDWSERKVRDVAEAMGADIVRCQQGFKLMSQITRAEIGMAIQARDSFRSQGIKNLRYSLKIGKRIHALLNSHE